MPAVVIFALIDSARSNPDDIPVVDHRAKIFLSLSYCQSLRDSQWYSDLNLRVTCLAQVGLMNDKFCLYNLAMGPNHCK
jgi:hypothetical protein